MRSGCSGLPMSLLLKKKSMVKVRVLKSSKSTSEKFSEIIIFNFDSLDLLATRSLLPA